LTDESRFEEEEEEFLIAMNVSTVDEKQPGRYIRNESGECALDAESTLHTLHNVRRPGGRERAAHHNLQKCGRL